MNKEKFLDDLKERLKQLPKEDLDVLMQDFQDHFQIGLDEGRNEKEIIKSLGSPQTIAKHVKAYMLVEQAQDNTSIGNLIKAIIATLSIGFFNIVFISGILVGLYVLLFAFFLAAGSIIFTGLLAIISPFISPFIETLSFGGIHPIVIFFFGIGLTSFGILFFIADGYVARWFYNITLKYCKMNIKIIDGVIE